MKILAVSDKVLPHLYAEDVTQRYPDVDMLIGCGDLPYYYLDFLVSAFNKPLLFVNGNHDGGSQYLADGSTIDRVQGGDDVDLRVVTRKGLTIAGLEGSIRYRPGLPHTYTEGEMKRRAARLMLSLLHHRLRTGRRLDILVTHSPPFGIHDAKDFPHVGFKMLLTFMRLVRPRYLLHGHVHRIRNDVPFVTRYHDTTVINVYPNYQLDIDVLE